MNTLFRQMWTEDDGVLSFEWVLLITLLAIGIVGGIAGMRDAIIDEMGDVAEAAVSIDQSYSLVGITVLNEEMEVVFSTPDNSFEDEAYYSDCDRSGGIPGQPAVDDVDS